MCFYQDTQILSKRLFSNLGAWEDTQDSKSLSSTKNEQETLINDTLIKKKKMLGIFPNFAFYLKSSLDTKAPGLFEQLTRICQEDINTDVTSVGSELEPEENKPLLHIPIPRKTSQPSDHANNYSAPIKGPIQKPYEPAAQETQRSEPKNSNVNGGDEQQQKILVLLMHNTKMLNNAMFQHDTSRKMVKDCLDSIRDFK